MGEPQEYLPDGTPLITAAQLGKLRLVRLLVEGGAQVNERNQRGETPLLAACRALRGGANANANASAKPDANASASANASAKPDANANVSASTLRLLRFLLENKADPNAQDKAGRTALMYACMEKAGPAVAGALIAAGADPSMEDYGGASALVYAINVREQETLRLLLDACRARGRDIIIIATDLSGAARGQSPVTRRYLNVPPSPDHSPVSCMSPSEIELRGAGGSPGSENDGENGGEGNFFNFRGAGKRGSGGGGGDPGAEEGGGGGGPGAEEGGGEPGEGRHPRAQRLHSEPWLAIRNLAHLRSSYEEGLRQAAVHEEEEEEDRGEEEPPQDLRACRRSSLLHPYGAADPPGARTPSPNTLSPGGHLPHLGRRNTLSCLPDTRLLQLPALTLTLNHAGSDSYLQAPPPGTPAQGPSRRTERYSSTWSLLPGDCAPATEASSRKKGPPHRGSFLPPLPICPGARPPAADMPPRPPQAMPRLEAGWRGRRVQRRHSVQLEQVGQVGQVGQMGQVGRLGQLGSSEEILIL